MHLNKEFTPAGDAPLFKLADVTVEAHELQYEIAADAEQFLNVLEGYAARLDVHAHLHRV